MKIKLRISNHTESVVQYPAGSKLQQTGLPKRHHYHYQTMCHCYIESLESEVAYWQYYICSNATEKFHTGTSCYLRYVEHIIGTRKITL